MNRRGFLGSILAAGVAPFICRAESLMACRVPLVGLILPEPFKIHEGNVEIFDEEDIPVEMVRQLGERMALQQSMIRFGLLYEMTKKHLQS